jgi:RimJ/RimL family protein N-acetyltransferase
MTALRERSTGRLRLRPIAEEDIPELVEIHVDPETNAHSPGGPPSRDQARSMIASFVASWDTTELSYWTVERADLVLGVVGVERRELLGRGTWNLYYRLSAASWGHGYATEAAREAVEAARLLDAALPITARTRPSNTRAVRVAERVGLARRPDLDHDGYVVLAANW